MNDATVMIGQTLDRYRIVSKLGEGGMGVVYKARDEQLNRTVAVKVLPGDRVADPARKERFVREARAASALNHPGIVTIHDVRSEGGVDFILMEFVEGRTLSDLIGSIRHPQALKYAVQIADAMASAHTAGILHRDLKPSNVMVTNDDRVKILDFGLAKLIEPKDSSPDSPTVPAHMLTLEGDVIGTAPYMSPEQAEGRKVDVRSDIFSFGALLYEMVTGLAAFNGPSRLAILSRILNEEPTPPRQIVPALPADLEKIILRCLRKEPNRRYQSMTDLKIALEDLAIESASERRVETPPSRRHWLWFLLALPLVIAAFFAWSAWRKSRPGESLRAVALTTFAGIELDPSLSPDGNHVAFTWNGEKQDNADVYVQMIGSGAPLRLTTDPRTDENPVWSPDGRWIAFLRFDSIAPMSRSRAELRLIAPLGGPERKLADIHTRRLEVYPRFLTWCPDSKCVVVSDSATDAQPDALVVVSLETGEKRRLTNPQLPSLADTSPAISPDGHTLAFRRVASWSSGDLYFLSLAKGVTAEDTPLRRVTGNLNPDYPAWLPDSEEILFSAKGNLWRVDADGDRPERLPFVGEDGVMPTISSPNDRRSTRLVYARSFEDDNVWRLDLSTPGSAPSQAIASTRSDTHVKFSSDGRRVVITSTRSGDWEIWTTDPDGGNAIQLTSMAARATGGPYWSPDDSQIVFASDVEGQFDLYVVSSAGGKPRRLTSAPSFEHGPSFSRDGRWIFFCSNRSGDYEIWRMPASGGEAIQLTRNGGWSALPSPDGASLYYTGTALTGATLWRVSVNGGEPERVLDGVRFWVFAPVGRGIYYAEDVGSKTRLQFFDFATARSTTIAHDFGDVRYVASVSADGRTMLYSRLDASINDLMLVENFR